MDGKRTYSIEINGIDRSIDAVKSLVTQLDALEKKINALSSKAVSVTSTGGGNNSKRDGGLDADAKLQKQIINQEDKIIAARKEEYQILLKQKQEFKEINQMQKEIVAQERLQADAYANTMNGLKLKLSDIKASMGNMEIGGDDFKNYQKQANEITKKLKELEAGYGQYGRNVGNYANGVAEGFEKIKVAVGDSTRSYDNYRQAVKDLTQERFKLAQTVGRESEEYKKVDQALEKLKSDYSDLNKSSAFMDNMLDTMESFTALASAGVGLSTLFGLEDSGFEETMKKLGALLVVMKSFETLNMQWKKGEGLMGLLKSGFDKMDSLGTNAGTKWAESFKKAALPVLETIYKGLYEIQGADKSGDKLYNARANRKRMPFEADLSDEVFQRKRAAEAAYDDRLVDASKNLENSKEFLKTYIASQRAVIAYYNSLGKLQAVMKGLQVVAKVTAKAIAGIFTAGLTLLLPELLNFFGDFIKSLNTTKLAAERAAQSMKAFNRELEVRRELLASSYLKGQISDEEYLSGLYEAQTNALIKQNEALKARSKALENNASGFWGRLWNAFDATQNTEYSGNRINPNGTTVGRGRLTTWAESGNDLQITIKNTKELETAWKRCNEAIAEGNDYFDKWGTKWQQWVTSSFVTVKDTEEVMRGLGNVALGDFTARFDEVNRQFKDGKINADQYAAELRKLKKEMDGSEVLNSVIANLDKYIPDEGVREAVQNIINEIARLDDAFNMTSEGQIHYWNQVRIDAMKDGMKKEMAQIQENERHEIVEYGKTQEQINLIHDKYQRQRLNAQDKANKEAQSKAKEHNRKLRDAENELIALRIENMKDGLDKQLAQIENERRLAIQKANENGTRAGEIIMQINLKYDKKVLDEKRKWAFEVMKIYEDLEARIEQVNRATFEKEVNTAEANVERRKNQDIRSAGYSAITPSTYDNTKDLEAYYKKVYDIEKKYLDMQTQIRQESLDRELDFNKKEEEIRHKRVIDENNGELVQQLRAGKITQEQYNDLIEKENAAHYARMNALDKEYASQSQDNTEENLKETQELYERYFSNIIEGLRNDKAKIDEIASKPPVTDKNGWDVVNIGKTSANYKKALADYDKLKNDIIAKQSELDAALKANQISPEDFAMKKSELDSEMKAINQSVQEVGESQKMLVANFVQSIQPYIQAAVQSFNTIMQAVWDAQDAAFDKEQESLDKELEEIETKLEKQKELTEKYKNDIESIEDELANSRGDRRQHLIDQLNAEIAAQRASWAEEKRIEKEREKTQQKQDELDNKRKKAQYKRDMMQAIVNGAMAVTMAAINKWPIPAIPMMALAASTTAAQLAIMASHKPYYADGGVLRGRSHKQGGIQLLNGQAEAEGGEYITNKRTTAKNVDLLDYINSKKKRLDLSDMVEFFNSKARANVKTISKTYLADGGIVSYSTPEINANDNIRDMLRAYGEKPIYVEVKEILNKADDIRHVQVLSGLESKSL